MMIRVAVVLFVVFALGGCRPFVHYDPDRGRSETRTHIVSKGETLYSIAWQFGHDYRTVAHWNGIRPPYTIYPGQEIRLYPASTATAAEDSDNDDDQSETTSTTRTSSKRHFPADTSVTWQWPVNGKILSTYSDSDPGKKGLDIGGRMGQAVYAAANGKVVYSGNGLRGYGNLIIIKHSATYFSAYAHNSKLHVKEDETVKSGQRIADMGNSGSDRVMLHFEIRRNGTPQDPLKYLPKMGS